MQVPAQLVELAAAWGRQCSLGWCGPGSGPADALGKGLAGGPARVLPWRCSRPRQGACWGSCGFPRLGSRRGSPSSGPHLISHVYDLDKDLHATTEVPPEPWFQCSWFGRNSWAQGWLALLVLGKLPWRGSRRGRGGRPGKGLARGVHLAPLLFSVSGLGAASVVLCSGFPPLPC